MAATAPTEGLTDIPCTEPFHIVKSAELCSGRARIKGTRVRVQDIVGVQRANQYTIDQLRGAYPDLSLAAIHAALAYYYDHVDEIEAAFDEDERAIDQFRREHPDRVWP